MQHPPGAQVQPSTTDIRLVRGDTDDAFYNTVLAERWWLPHMGPTSFLLARRLLTDGKAGSNSFDVEMMASNLGVSPAKLMQSFQRMTRFGPAWVDDDGTTALPHYWPRP